MSTQYIDLVLTTGELVRIECAESDFDAVHDSLENAMKRGDWWSPHAFEGCTATLLGLTLGRVAMNKVVAAL